MKTKITVVRQEWLRLIDKLSALNPASVLGRGFALVQTPAGAVVRDAGTVSLGDLLKVILNRGWLGCRVEEVNPEFEKMKLVSPPDFSQEGSSDKLESDR